MTLKRYQVLFWVMLSMTIFVFSWYAYLYSRGLVTFTAGPDVNTTDTVNSSPVIEVEETE